MIWLCILLGAAVLALLFCLYAAERCVCMVTQATRHDEKFVWDQQTDAGFGDALERYAQEWERRPFTLESNGVALAGEVIPNPADRGDRHRVVIFCHGHTVDRLCSVKYADLFYRAGYSIVLYDERYFGRSTGRCCTLGQEEAKDLREVMAFTRREFGEDCVLGLHGESMGGATVLLVLAWEKPDFVISDCPFADSTELFRHVLRDDVHLPTFPILPMAALLGRMQFGYDFPRVNPIRAAEGSETPICLMHGEADTLIPCEHSKEIFAVCRNPRSRLFLFPGAQHASSIAVDRAGYEERALAFVEACVGAATQQK